MLARRLTVLAIAAASAGCALVLGYGDAVEVAPRADGGGGDAGDGGDAASDARSDSGVDANAPFCESLSPAPTFCASFDAPSYLAGWGSSDAVVATLERNTTAFVSAPASMRSAIDHLTNGNVSAGVSVEFGAFDGRTFTGAIQFDVRVETGAPQGAFAVIGNPLLVASSGSPDPYLLQLVAVPLADGTSSSLSLVEVAGPGNVTSHATSATLTVAKWAHLDLTIVIGSRGATGNSVKLLVDGKPAFNGPLVAKIGSGPPTSTFGLAAVDSATTAWALSYDNVVIDLR